MLFPSLNGLLGRVIAGREAKNDYGPRNHHFGRGKGFCVCARRGFSEHPDTLFFSFALGIEDLVEGISRIGERVF
ncbi:MAG: hypothetical protein Ct9H300mP26_1590 [Acidimicrobiales bacterium]|nr:MAG: hypothetical protein Ct9H300mP26_1590 [Acidimicrobiales bacterium]